MICDPVIPECVTTPGGYTVALAIAVALMAIYWTQTRRNK